MALMQRSEELQRTTGTARNVRSSRHDDEWVRQYWAFIRQLQTASELDIVALQHNFPGIYAARDIFTRTAEPEFMTILECRILARQSDEEIAAQMSTVPDVAFWYEKLFFHVRERLDAQDWLVKHVLLTAIQSDRNQYLNTQRQQAAPGAAPLPRALTVAPLAEPYYDATLRIFAYFGGPQVLDLLLTGFPRTAHPRGEAEVGAWLTRVTVGRLMQRIAAATQRFNITSTNITDLMAIVGRIYEIESNKRLDTESKNRSIESALMEVRDSFTWAVGESGAKRLEKAPVAAFDTGAAELRDSELHSIMTYGEAVGPKDILQLKMPTPLRK